MKKKYIAILIAISVVVIATVLTTTVLGLKVSNGKLYVRSDAYSHVGPGMGSCMAIMPECGVCQDGAKEGFVENKVCYLPL